MILTINAHREGYAPDQIASTMTVGELIEFLNNFDEDMTTAIPTAGLPLPGSKKSRKKPKTNKPNQGGRKAARNQRSENENL